jgi:hypothetical protein
MRDRPVDEGVEISAPTDLKLMREWTAGAAVRRAARRVDKPTALVLLGLGALIAVAVATVSMMPSGGDPASQLTLPLPGSSTVLRRLVHGSCSKQSLPHPFWATVQSHQPQLFVYNGERLTPRRRVTATSPLPAPRPPPTTADSPYAYFTYT